MVGPLFPINGRKALRISSKMEISKRPVDIIPFHLISIHGSKERPAVPLSPPSASLFLVFDDIDEPVSGLIQMGKDHAEKIANFVADWMESESQLLVVQCDAGISRSSGVAAGILRFLAETAEESGAVFNHPLYHPNRRVYNLVSMAMLGSE